MVSDKFNLITRASDGPILYRDLTCRRPCVKMLLLLLLLIKLPPVVLNFLVWGRIFPTNSRSVTSIWCLEVFLWLSTTLCQSLASNSVGGKKFCNHLGRLYRGPYTWAIFGVPGTKLCFTSRRHLCNIVCTLLWRVSIRSWKLFVVMMRLLILITVYSLVSIMTVNHFFFVFNVVVSFLYLP